MRPSFATLSLCGLVTSALVPVVAADYYIDNANSTVAYAASGVTWRTFSFATQNLTLMLSEGNVTVDSSKCYDQNYALAACTVENKCQITWPFTGSGISVYILNAGFQGVSASLTIDGGQSVTTTLPAPVPPSYQTPNVSLFSLQSLPSADHTAQINVLDWNNGATSLYFDYALVNESRVELPISSLATPSPSSTSSSPPAIPPAIAVTSVLQSSAAQSTNPSSTSPAPANVSTSTGSTYTPTSAAKFSIDLGAVVGGACGGFAFLIAVVAAVFFLRKRKYRFTALDESRRPDPFPSIPALAHDQTISLPAQPQTNEKSRMRLAALDAMLYQYHGPSVSTSDFHISSAAGEARRIPEVEAGSSTVSDDHVIEICRREDRPLSTVRGSVVRDPSGSIVTGHSAPPPGYQTLDSRR